MSEENHNTIFCEKKSDGSSSRDGMETTQQSDVEHSGAQTTEEQLSECRVNEKDGDGTLSVKADNAVCFFINKNNHMKETDHTSTSTVTAYKEQSDLSSAISTGKLSADELEASPQGKCSNSDGIWKTYDHPSLSTEGKCKKLESPTLSDSTRNLDTCSTKEKRVLHDFIKNGDISDEKDCRSIAASEVAKETISSPDCISQNNYLNFAEILYKCSLCTSIPMIFTSHLSFKKHVEKTHVIKNNQNSHFCDRCNLRFSTREDLLSHLCIQWQNSRKQTHLLTDLQTSGNKDDVTTTDRGFHVQPLWLDNEQRYDVSRRHAGGRQMQFLSSVPSIASTQGDTFFEDNNHHQSFIHQQRSEHWSLGKRNRKLSPDRTLNVKKIREVTDNILRSNLKNTQGNSVKSGKTPALIPGCTPEFGRYTKLVREGGNVVYFCQVCNLKSQLKFAFHVHCNTEHHHNKVRLADLNRFDLLEKQPRKCFKSAVDLPTSKKEDGAVDSEGTDRKTTSEDLDSSSSGCSESYEENAECRESEDSHTSQVRVSHKSEDAGYSRPVSDEVKKCASNDQAKGRHKIGRVESIELPCLDSKTEETSTETKSQNDNVLPAIMSDRQSEISCRISDFVQHDDSERHLNDKYVRETSDYTLQQAEEDSLSHAKDYSHLLYGSPFGNYINTEANSSIVSYTHMDGCEDGSNSTSVHSSRPTFCRNSVKQDTRISLRNKIQGNVKEELCQSIHDKTLMTSDHEKTEKLYRCSLCQFSCDNIMNYKNHYDINHGTDHSDDRCGQELTDSPKTTYQGLEGMKVQQLRKILPEIIRANPRCSVSRDVLLQKVSHIWDLQEVITWGSACNKAFREAFPECLSQRKGKFKNYYFGVEFVNDIFDQAEQSEEREAASDSESVPSYHPMRDFSQDLETILEHLPDIVEWTGDTECGISRDDILSVLRYKLQEPEARFWSVACNKAARVIFPGVNIKRKGKYKTTYYFGLNFISETDKKSVIYEKNITQDRTEPDETTHLPVVNLGHIGSQQTDHMIISSNEDSTKEETPNFVFSEVREDQDCEDNEESTSSMDTKENSITVFDMQ